jgi:transposase
LLVCGSVSLVSTDALVNFIRYQLQNDPFDGNIYVFCNNACTHLKWLEWDGSGFCVGSRQAEWGKYPWPTDKKVAAIEVTEHEFRFLCGKSTEYI